MIILDLPITLLSQRAERVERAQGLRLPKGAPAAGRGCACVGKPEDTRGGDAEEVCEEAQDLRLRGRGDENLWHSGCGAAPPVCARGMRAPPQARIR